jgi:hypothetical protein
MRVTASLTTSQPKQSTRTRAEPLQDAINLISEDEMDQESHQTTPSFPVDSRIPIFVASDERTPDMVRKFIWAIEQVRSCIKILNMYSNPMTQLKRERTETRNGPLEDAIAGIERLVFAPCAPSTG